MKILGKTIALLGAALCIVLSGCGGEAPAEGPETEQAGTESKDTPAETQEYAEEASDNTQFPQS